MALTTKFLKTDTATISSNAGLSSSISLGGRSFTSSYSVLATTIAYNSISAVSIGAYTTPTSNIATTSSTFSSTLYTVPAGRTAKIIINPGVISDLLSNQISLSPSASGSLSMAVNYGSYAYFSGSVTVSAYIGLSWYIGNTINYIVSINNYKMLDLSSTYNSSYSTSTLLGSILATVENVGYSSNSVVNASFLGATAPAAIASTNSTNSKVTGQLSTFMGPGDSIVVSALVTNTLQIAGVSGGFIVSWNISGPGTSWAASTTIVASGSIGGGIVNQSASVSQLRTALFGCLVIEESGN